MPQFLLSPDDVRGGKFILRGPEAEHLTRVMRRRKGDSVELFDGQGGRYTGVIEEIQGDVVAGSITGERPAYRGLQDARLNLHLSLLKAGHWEWALEKATELGAASFTPVVSARSVVRLKEDAVPGKLRRWAKILEAAAKQCGRADIPELKDLLSFKDALAWAKGGLLLVAWEKKDAASASSGLRETLAQAKAKTREPLDVNVFIGPEGGFTEEEIALAESAGAHTFSLGPHTLRAETAAAAAAAVILHELA